jgi:hypothetical protein
MNATGKKARALNGQNRAGLKRSGRHKRADKKFVDNKVTPQQFMASKA